MIFVSGTDEGKCRQMGKEEEKGKTEDKKEEQ
jgi:hypothetical protein